MYFFFFLSHFHIPASGQAVVTGVVPAPPSPRFLPSIFIAHRVQQSHCSSIFHRALLLTHALLALSASQFVPKKKSQRIYTSMHSARLELTKLTYTRLEDNLTRHRGDRSPRPNPNPEKQISGQVDDEAHGLNLSIQRKYRMTRLTFRPFGVKELRHPQNISAQEWYTFNTPIVARARFTCRGSSRMRVSRPDMT